MAPPVWMAVALEAVHQNIYDTVHISMIRTFDNSACDLILVVE
jgi:hypothetical protein